MEEENKKDYKDLLEKLAADNAKDLIWLLLGSLISADQVVNIPTCENSIFMLTELKKAVDRLTPGLYTDEEITKIKNYCDDGLEICNQDLEVFKKNEAADKDSKEDTIL